ncbi:MAG: serine hydrolase domain-containing protein [Woeseiaceae bacterium]
MTGIPIRLVPCVALLAAAALAHAEYTPPAGRWESRPAAQIGMDAQAVREAVAFAEASASAAPRDLALAHRLSFGREPHGEAIGPFRTRGPATGLILRHGYIVAEWGDTSRVDMTFSVTKSFLSTVVGLAWADGRIRDLDDPVAPYMAPVLLLAGDGERGLQVAASSPEPVTLFEDAHNRLITWEQLLRQTSAWRGTLWGKPDWADRPGPDPATWPDPTRAKPGTEWEYNDVRVNLLALAALQVWRKPLPTVLRERVMDRIGASATWRWHGYENSWLTLDGERMQSVSGGGHWGGGMFISARDQARFGLFTLRRGNWDGEQLLRAEWFRMALSPTDAKASPDYGFMNYFLNLPDGAGNKRYPSAPRDAYAHIGNGTNMVYVDPANDLVVVARWIADDRIDAFLGRVIAAIDE